MPCYHPSKVDVERKLLAGSSRRRDAVTVPCGSCLGCRTDQQRSWAIRLEHESYCHPNAWFITLTYSPENVPGFQDGDDRVHGTLDPNDCRLFLRRLRRRFRRPLTFYLCGEYGSETQRPHYHALLFGAEFLDRTRFTTRGGNAVWQSDTLDAAWQNGIAELTGFDYKAAMYVAGYVRKKVRQRDEPEFYERVVPETGELVQLHPEFARMSRRPAIGRRFMERYWQDVYPRDYVVVNGYEMKPPRYYDKWMDDNQPEVMEEVRFQRFKDAVEIGDEKLIMKEKVHRARIGLFDKRDKI